MCMQKAILILSVANKNRQWMLCQLPDSESILLEDFDTKEGVRQLDLHAFLAKQDRCSDSGSCNKSPLLSAAMSLLVQVRFACLME